MPPRPASIKVRALQWLAQREHSPTELRGKLLRLLQAGPGRGFSASRNESDEAGPADLAAIEHEVDTLLDWLTARGYLSADRFVESRVHVRQPRCGNLRIQQELRQHGLALDADARQALADSELQRAAVVWRKKFAAPAKDATERVRQMRFLGGRGFSPEVIRRVVRMGGADAQSPAAADAQADLDGRDRQP